MLDSTTVTMYERPSGLTYEDSEFNATRFRDMLLIPALLKSKKVEVDLNTCEIGFASGFLEEVFGGLIRRDFTESELRGRLTIIHDRKIWPERCWRYIRQAQAAKDLIKYEDKVSDTPTKLRSIEWEQNAIQACELIRKCRYHDPKRKDIVQGLCNGNYMRILKEEGSRTYVTNRAHLLYQHLCRVIDCEPEYDLSYFEKMYDFVTYKNPNNEPRYFSMSCTRTELVK